MSQSSDRLVGNSFRPGYRFQRYWDTSMALAFFFAEVGTGLFAVSLHFGHAPGMAAGLLLALTLKPCFHLAHMGVPGKSWRALARPDRSWVSRGALAIGALGAFGLLHLLDRLQWLALPADAATLVKYAALAAALVVMCYQGFAMSASASFALWATPLLPLSSMLYALTAGVLLASLIGAGEAWVPSLLLAGQGLLVLDLAVVFAILGHARRKSKGGAFSVELLMKGRYAPGFRNLVLLAGLVLPLVLVGVAGGHLALRALATAAMLAGLYGFRIMMFRAAVYEPITHDLAAGIGLPSRL